ncbi:MAG TPA: polyprenol monophosphomannose synthase [Actinocrinis sp.]|nr:polyprenol monophosphomannose synthase [Actinocrinis sp.]
MTDSTGGRITVVVPTYNEKDNLPKLVDQLLALPLEGLRILVVDDNSPDGTGEVADKMAAETPEHVDVLHRTVKDGLGRAYITGMTRALDDGADIVVQMDADLSHPSSVIPLMIETLRTTDAGVVLGSRYVAGGKVAAEWPWHRRALSAWANFYVNAILRLHVRDATAGFKAWHAATLRAIDLETIRSNGYSFQVEMNYRAVRAGRSIAEVPITFSERVEGVSKMSLKVQLESALTPWRLRFGRPVK